ncbi:MAG: hypothetical protein QXK12_03600 [Candidatus Nezhaarchaeales archaeon]
MAKREITLKRMVETAITAYMTFKDLPIPVEEVVKRRSIREALMGPRGFL